jgi:hypothetical protein
VSYSKVTSTQNSTAPSFQRTSRTSLATAGTNKHAHMKASVATRLWYIKQLKMNKCHIGNTQQHVKMRMQGNVQDVNILFINGKSSDSFALHFASLVPEGTAKKKCQGFHQGQSQHPMAG